MARAQSSRNSEVHYSGHSNVINKLIPSWAFRRTRNIPSGMSYVVSYAVHVATVQYVKYSMLSTELHVVLSFKERQGY